MSLLSVSCCVVKQLPHPHTLDTRHPERFGALRVSRGSFFGTPPPHVALKGRFDLRAALEEELDEPTIANLPRLVFPFNRRSAGRLRQLIDYVNSL